MKLEQISRHPLVKGAAARTSGERPGDGDALEVDVKVSPGETGGEDGAEGNPEYRYPAPDGALTLRRYEGGEEEEEASEEVEVQSAEARERAWKTKRNRKKKMKRKNRLKRKLLGLMSGTRGESPQINPSSNVNPPTDEKIYEEEENKQKK